MRDINSSRQRSWISIAALSCALVLAAGLALGMTSCSCSQQNQTAQRTTQQTSSTSTQKDIPNVVGMTKDDAVRVVQDAGFKTGTITEEENEQIAAGMIASQNPKAATKADAGKTIDLVVSKAVQKAPEQVAVPNLMGMTQTQAEEALAKVKLLPKAEDPVYESSAAPGKIFRQSVAEGTHVDAGTTVSFTAALGSEVTPVPLITGATRNAAAQMLIDAGFNVDIVEQYSSDVAEGLVIEQNPYSRVMCVKGTTVVMSISKGAATQPTEQIPVPNVATLTLPQAQMVLESAGLACRFTGDETGNVIEQSIVAGTMVDRNTTVTVTLQNYYTNEVEPYPEIIVQD